MPPDEFERRYVETCRAWGRDRLHDFPHADRLAELLWLVAGSADISATPLFAGWRAVPLPDDPPARVAQLAHVLREHRGGLHLVAVLANGLTPLEAVLTRGQGSERARFLGWPKPYPSMSEAMHKRRTEVEQLTDDLAAPAYASLGVDQLAELHRLAEQAYRTVLAERRS